MKAKSYAMILMAAVLLTGTAVYGEAAEERGYIGVRMDARPLPELLTKHLRLDEDQGIRIQNVGVGTPGDKAGLERDDIIIGFEGKDVTDSEKFARAVQETGAGAEVTLEIIHLGRRKTVKLELTSFTDDFKAKYPPEPELVGAWQPGRMFHFQPEVDKWLQVRPEGGAQLDLNTMLTIPGPDVEGLFKELYKYHYSTDEGDYSITIEGSPSDDDAKVIVRADGEEHTTTVGKIDKLPKKYQGAAEEAVKKARRTAKLRQYRREIRTPAVPGIPGAQIWPYFRERPDVPRFVPGEDMYKRMEKMEKQMRELQERIERLEKERGKKSRGSADDDESEEEAEEHKDSADENEEEKI